jgi:holliday junction DNA helicase RuvA
MIARLRGTPVANTPEGLILDVGGVGYLVHATPAAVRKGDSADEITVETYTHVREDALQLFGFATVEEEGLFHLLISVSAVGPKLALNILSGMPAPELATAILHGELARLTKIPGVGKKTAERLVVELKDKIRTSGIASARPSRPPPAASGEEALLSALVNLGYRPAAAERTAESVRRNLGAAAPLEDQLREALRLIAGAP